MLLIVLCYKNERRILYNEDIMAWNQNHFKQLLQ